MGGDLTVESRPGEGSRFTLWLPASSPASGSLDSRIRVGAVDRVEPWPEGLADVGRILQARLASIVASFARRLRADPQTPLAAGMSDAALLDHAPVFVADLAGIMMKLDRSAGDAAVLREAGDLQGIIAAKHGADRARRGWTASALRREFEILQREIARVIRESVPPSDLGGVLGILDRLIEGARRASLRSLRAASAGDAPAAS
jgi:hypothetical protein